jgi:hypothetical protein
MRSAVVFESWFGNTHEVAKAVARELGRVGEVELLSADDLPPAFEELDLLVVGAPTHVHGLSSARSRRAALDQRGRTGEPGIGVRGWLKELPAVEGIRAAAFDTRIENPVLLTGSAARGIARRLERKGFELVAPPESFFVTDSEGPLADGELRRAAAWAWTIADARVTSPTR